MYDNIGGKIKGLAKVGFIVEAIAAVITGIALMALDGDMILIGLLVMLLGPIVAWVSSWLLYGFGELIDNVCRIAANTRTLKNESTSFNTANNAVNKMESSKEISTKPFFKSVSTNQTSTQRQCPHCGETITSKICAMCGKENNLFK